MGRSHYLPVEFFWDEGEEELRDASADGQGRLSTP
jgi:hypothetical protein